jgi:uncharacterized protein (TIGR03435 family)
MKRTAVLAASVVAAVASVAAQAPKSFEVASVKPSAPNPGDPLNSIPRMVPANGRLTVANMPLRLLIRIAYEVQDFQISGGPPDLMTARFDITAKSEDGVTPTTKDTLAMLRSLLVERFKLKTHTQPKEMPIYALMVARSDGRLGPDLRPSASDCVGKEAKTQIPCTVLPMMAGAGSFGLRAKGQTLEALLSILTQATGRTVVDKTGLTGLYDFQLKFDPEVMLRMVSQQGVNLPTPASVPPSDSPALMTAIQEQLGLKLDSQRGPVDSLVIDHIEAPAPD